MKKYIVFIPVLIIISIFLSPMVFAENVYIEDNGSGYFIKDYHVDITANDDRSFDIVETIDVHFTEPRRGIYRNIDLFGAAEDFWFSEDGVIVEGAPFLDEGYGNIRIGDPNVEISGDKRYVISYTLMSYADYDKNADYLYLDIIGTGWDTTILDFSATITLPENAYIKDYTLTSGWYGSTNEQQNIATVTQQGNTYSIMGNSGLAPYNGVTINVEMEEGAYPNAPIYIPPYTINNVTTEMTVGENLRFSVVENYKVTKNYDESEYLYRDYDITATERTTVNTKNIAISGDGVTFADENLVQFLDSLKKGDTAEYTITYDLDIVSTDLYPVDYVSFDLIGITHERNIVENARFVFTSPVPATLYVNEISEQDYSISGDGTGNITLDFKESVLGDREVDLTLTFDPEALIPKTSIAEYGLIGVIILFVLGLLGYLLLNKNAPLVTPTEYYPPDNLNPAALGCILRGKAHEKDVSSLIFYWASKGFIKIELQKNNKFTLYKLKELDDNHEQYEIDLFYSIFLKADGEKITSQKLHNDIYISIENTRAKVTKSFNGETALLDKKSQTFSQGSILIGVLGMAVLSLVVALINSLPIFDIAVSWAFLLFPLLFFTYSIERLVVSKHRQTVGNFIILVLTTSALLIGVMFFVLILGYFFSALVVLPLVIASIAIVIIGNNIPKRTEYGHKMLGRTLGFKRFLKTAKKEQLETLLAQNPTYYYDILPYANVLGVSKIWKNKLDVFETQPSSPVWVDYTDVGRDITIGAALNSALYSVGRTVTYKSTSSGSSSGGSSGGGFSGGGYSGGGGGGGGGSSW